MFREIMNLEVHVADSCNLVCEGCSHYSNHNHRGVLSIDSFKEWSKPWNNRLRPKLFSLLGGEPCIHPQLPDFVMTARELWPHSGLRLVTNGLLLDRHPDLPNALLESGRVVLNITIHHDSPTFLMELAANLKLVQDWILQYGIEVMFDKGFRNWTRRYEGFGENLHPYNDNNIRKSWVNCPGKFCRQLYDGKIWKCAPLAYLPMQNEKYGLSSDWKQYLDYNPLRPESSDEELNAFFDKKEEKYCNMCPAEPVVFDKPSPFRKQRVSDYTYDDIDPFVMFAAFNPDSLNPEAVQKAAGVVTPNVSFDRAHGDISVKDL